jgi:chemotaxis regulatin CheY-phosphate phosphatase CheZ
MSTGPWEFVEDVMDALKITPPGTGEYDAAECADLALKEIERLQERAERFSLEDFLPNTKLDKIKFAARLIKKARNNLREAGARMAAKAAARALKSVEGAERHARGMEIRKEMDNASTV